MTKTLFGQPRGRCNRDSAQSNSLNVEELLPRNCHEMVRDNSESSFWDSRFTVMERKTMVQSYLNPD
jgi:hypothetical protein